MASSNFVKFLFKLRQYLYYEVLGGPKIFTLRWIVNLFKGLTWLWILNIMWIFNNYSSSMYLYLALHGSYGWMWVFKDIFFPDFNLLKKNTIGSSIILTIVLILYWLIPIPLVFNVSSNITTQRIIYCSVIYVCGLILMMGSDYQKYRTLQRKKGLINSGFFKTTRNPNYLGEIMIYGSFVMVSGHWLGWTIVMSIWLSLFATNMYLKDQLSYKNKQGWKVYEQNTYMLLPKIFNNHLINIGIYSILIALFIYNEVQQINCTSLGIIFGQFYSKVFSQNLIEL